MIRRPQIHMIGGGKLMLDYRDLSLVSRPQIHMIAALL
jgi:hypothetical protein